MIFIEKIILSKSNLCARRTNSKNFTLNSFTGYLSPRKNFTSLAYRITLSVQCTYCGQPDSISHTFIRVPPFQKVLSKCLTTFHEENATSFTQSDGELLFGKSLNTTGQLQRPLLLKKLNYCMLFAKHYLNNQKLNQIEPELNEFNSRLNFKYHIEKLVSML